MAQRYKFGLIPSLSSFDSDTIKFSNVQVISFEKVANTSPVKRSVSGAEEIMAKLEVTYDVIGEKDDSSESGLSSAAESELAKSIKNGLVAQLTAVTFDSGIWWNSGIWWYY